MHHDRAASLISKLTFKIPNSLKLGTLRYKNINNITTKALLKAWMQHHFQISSNRPLIKSIPNNRKKPEYKAIDARIEMMSFFESIISEIQSHVKRLDKPPFDWSQHPKNLN